MKEKFKYMKTDDGKIYLVDIDQRYRYEKSFRCYSRWCCGKLANG